MVITLITVTEIHKWSVVALVLLGIIFFSVSAYGMGWTGTRVRFVVINLAICLVMVCLGWSVWPHPIQQKPNIGASLVIDSIGDKYINFHIQINNAITSPTVNDLLYSIKTPDAFQKEFASPMVRTLEPGRDLTIQPPPFFLTVREYNSALLSLLYSIDVEGTRHDFGSTYRFFVSLKQVSKGSVISPEGVDQKELTRN